MSEFTPDPNLVVEALRTIAEITQADIDSGLLTPREEAREALPHAEAIAEMLGKDSTRQLHDAIQELIAAARELDDVYENRIGFMDPGNNQPWSCLDIADYTLLEDVSDRLRAALKPFEAEAVSS